MYEYIVIRNVACCISYLMRHLLAIWFIYCIILTSMLWCCLLTWMTSSLYKRNMFAFGRSIITWSMFLENCADGTKAESCKNTMLQVCRQDNPVAMFSHAYFLHFVFSFHCQRNSASNTTEENSWHPIPNPNALVAVRKGMWAVKLCSNKIFQFLSGVSG